jgi:fructose-bisphosphate aldolase class II
VIKVNVDTDLQWAYLTGIRDYVTKNIDYLKTQVGNPEGPNKPNKKKYDPRVCATLPSNIPMYGF